MKGKRWILIDIIPLPNCGLSAKEFPKQPGSATVCGITISRIGLPGRMKDDGKPDWWTNAKVMMELHFAQCSETGIVARIALLQS